MKTLVRCLIPLILGSTCFADEVAVQSLLVPTGVSVVRNIAFETAGKTQTATVATPVLIEDDGLYFSPENIPEVLAFARELREYIRDMDALSAQGKKLMAKWEEIKKKANPLCQKTVPKASASPSR